MSQLTLRRQLGPMWGTAPSALQVWRGEDPYRTFVVGPGTLHRNKACFYRIEELARETVRAAIHWLPPTLKYGALKIIGDAALGGGPFREGPAENRPGRGVRHKSKGTGHPPLSGGDLPRGEPLPPSSLCQPDVRNVGILFGHAPLVQQVPERQQRQKQVRSLEGAEGDFCGQIEESAPTPDN